MRPIRYLPVTEGGAALSAIAAGDAALLAGGTSLLDLMKLDVLTPERLVDINALPLATIEPQSDGGLRIGALVRNSELAWDERVRTRYPMLSEALLAGASPQLRNMATTAGNVMQRTRCWYFRDVASPCNKRTPGSGCGAIDGQNRIHAIVGTSDKCIAVHPSDMCVAMAALDATVIVGGPKGERRVPFVDFHRLPGDTPHLETALEPAEMIVAVTLPNAPWAARSRYLKIRDRASYAFALVSVAAALEMDGKTIKSARLALGGIGTKPWRAVDAEKALVGKEASEATFRAAAATVTAGAKPRKHNAFKVELAQRAVVRALTLVHGGAA